MTAEPDIVVDHREELIALLTEASEIEHGLMCCYLYAAFSLKTTADSGLNREQLAATRRWRAIILDVAIEEMMHLGLVSNLMSAIGARPNFSRQNFPVSPGYHPAGVSVELMRFCKATVDHFVYLERPEGVDLPDGDGFGVTRDYHRRMDEGGLLPTGQDFLTVGHLYRSIEAAFSGLSQKLGEASLFIGAPSAQLRPKISGFDKLIAVTDLASAKAAIEAIVEQGEGAPGHSDDSHFSKFCRLRDEYAALAAASPSLDFAWPAAHNPVLRRPLAPEGRVHVTSAEPRRLLDIATSAYGLMLRCLMACFGQVDSSEADQSAFYGAAIDLMHAVTPLAERLVQTPAQDGAATPTAGMTFTLPRSIAPLASTETSLRVAIERASELGEACDAYASRYASLSLAAPLFKAVAKALSQRLSQRGSSATPSPARTETPMEPAKQEVAKPSGAVEEAVGAKITIRFDAKRCIHSRFCVLEAPTVFLANTPGAWIFPDTMDADRLVAIAEKCPSGAITYERHDGKSEEPAPPVNVARIRENGPYAIGADIDLAGEPLLRATLCRCGASKNKPFCDGSHHAIDFAASGEPATRDSQPLPARGGKLAINPMPNGPLAVRGALEICAGTGRTVDRVTSAKLCRCGGSANKPYCDGTHVRIGFRSDA